jgi:hypothetical protein
VGTVDYVWFTPDALAGGECGGGDGGGGPPSTATVLRPLRVLAPPPLAALPAGLPTAAFGSDHIAVVADFGVWGGGGGEG